MKRKVPLYTKRRYWYHVSTTLKRKELRLTPLNEQQSTNRGTGEPPGARICVAPTIEQCITAIPFGCRGGFAIYRTKSPVLATRPSPTRDIFDWKVTREGWLLKSTNFIKIGSIRLSDIRRREKIDDISEAPAACNSSLKDSIKSLKWWRSLKLRQRYLK